MDRKLLRHHGILVVTLLTLFSCKKDIGLQEQNRQDLPTVVENQIAQAKRNLGLLGLPATLVSYRFESSIANEADLQNLKQSLVANETPVPSFNGLESSSFAVSTIRERMTLFRAHPEREQNVLRNMEEMVFPQLKAEQKVMSLHWRVDGRDFRSRCIYDESGIVYDHMLSNIVVFKQEEAAKEEDRLFSPDSYISGELAKTGQKSFSSTVRDYTIGWIWGGTRGKIIIKHYIIYKPGYIVDHGGSTNAWMTAGSASAKWKNNFLQRNSRSKMAWAFGWATPTAKFSISFNAKSLTFSTSTSGVGSKGSGSGVHTIYL